MGTYYVGTTRPGGAIKEDWGFSKLSTTSIELTQTRVIVSESLSYVKPEKSIKNILKIRHNDDSIQKRMPNANN